MAVSTGRGERNPRGSDILEKLKEMGQAIKELQGMKADVNIDTSSIDKADKKAKGLSKTLGEAAKASDSLNKTLGKGGQMNYFATQEKMLEQLTGAWEELSKAQTEAEQKKSKGRIMNWANAYRAMGYDEKKVNKQIFEVADQHFKSYEGRRKDGSIYNSQSTFSVDDLKKVFSEALKQGADIHASESYWQQRNGTKKAEKRAVKQQIEEIEKEAKTISFDDLYKVDEAGIKERIRSLRESLGELTSKYNTKGLGKTDAKKYVEFYLELENYIKKFGETIPKELASLAVDVNNGGKYGKIFQSLKDYMDLDNDANKTEKKAFSFKDASRTAAGRVSRTLDKASIATATSRKQNGEAPSESAVSDVAKAATENAKQAAEALEEQAKAQEQVNEAQKEGNKLESGSATTEKAKEAAAALTEEKKAQDAVNAAKDAGKSAGATSNTAIESKKATDALKQQAKAQEEVNKQEKESSSSQSSRSAETKAKTIKEQYEDAIKLIHQLEAKQAQLLGKHEATDNAYTKALEAKRRADAKGEDFEKGLSTKDDFIRVIKDSIKEKNYDKAAAYLGLGTEVGKQNNFKMPLLSTTRKDGSKHILNEELMSRYNEMKDEANVNLGEVNRELNEINQRLLVERENAKNLKMQLLSEEGNEEAPVGDGKATKASTSAQKPEWQNGLDDKEIKAVEVYIKRLKTLRKEAYDESQALEEALNLLAKFKSNDVAGILETGSFKAKNSPESLMLAQMTGMPVNQKDLRNQAIRSINPEAYDQLFPQSVQGTEQALADVAEQEQVVSDKAKELANTITKDFGIKGKEAIQSIAIEIDKIIESASKGETTSFDNLISKLSEYYKLTKDEKGDLTGQYDQLRAFISKSKIHKDSEMQAEFGDDWNLVRNTIGSRVVSATGGSDIMTVLREANDTLGTTFDLTTSNAEGWRQLYEALQHPPKLDVFNAFRDLATSDSVSVINMITDSIRELGYEIKKTGIATDEDGFATVPTGGDGFDEDDFFGEATQQENEFRESEEQAGEAIDRNNQSLKERIEYLKQIKAESKFLETAEERKSDMEDKAWDAGGNNPRATEAQSQSLISKYESHVERMESANALIDGFEDEYEQVIITMKNGEEIAVQYASDLEDVSLAANKIADIKFVPFSDANESPVQDLEEFDRQISEVEFKTRQMVEKLAKIYAEPISSSGSEDYYKDLYSQIENIGQAAAELKSNLSGMDIPETATNLTGRRDRITNQFAWIDQMVALQKGRVQEIYDSIDFEAQKAAEELERKISARQQDMTQRILGNADFKKYGEQGWMTEYINLARTDSREIDEIYAELEAKLAERKKNILEAEAREEKKVENRNQFQSFLRGVSPEGSEEYGRKFAQYSELFNSITDDVNTLDAAIQRVKDDMASVENPKHLDMAPEGWKKLEGSLTAPQGYEWWTNGASRFSSEYQAALVKVREETQETKDAIVRSQEEIQAEIEETNGIIKNQEYWMRYLGDPNVAVTSTGKRDATDKLRSATNRLVSYRMHPEQFYGQLDEEKITVGWWKAMQEAKRQGVADSVLSRYNTDISQFDYEKALSRLNESLASHKNTLQESKDKLAQLQTELQQSISTVEQHKEEKQAAEDAAKAEEELAKKKEEAANAGKSNRGDSDNKKEAEAARDAAKAEEEKASAKRKSSDETSKSDAQAESDKKAAEAARDTAKAGKEAEEGLKAEGTGAETAAVSKEKATKANKELAASMKETQNAGHSAAEGINDENDAVSKSPLLGQMSESSENKRIVRESWNRDGSITASYELSKGLRRNELYAWEKNEEGEEGWVLKQVDEVADYNALLKDTLDLTKRLALAQANLKLQQKKGAGKDVIDAINKEISYYGGRIKSNNRLAQQYEERSAVPANGYTKRQYDKDVAEQTRLINLSTAEKSAKEIETEMARQQRTIEQANTWLSNQLEKVRDLNNKYDSSINPEASKGIKRQTDLDQYQTQAQELVDFIEGLRGARIDAADADHVAELIGSLKRLGDNLFAKGQAATGDLSKRDIDIQKSVLSSRIDSFIAGASRSKGDTSEVIEQAEKLKTTLSSLSSGEQVTKSFDKLKVLKAQLQAINEEYKTLQETVFDKINAVYEARSKVTLAEASQISSGNTPASVKNMTQAMEDLRKAEDTATDAYFNLIELWDNGELTDAEFSDWYDKLTGKSSDASIQAKEIAEQKARQKAVDELAATYIKLAEAEEKASYGADAVAKARGKAEVENIKARQTELGKQIPEDVRTEEQKEQLKIAQSRAGDLKNAYDEARGVLSAKGLGFEEGKDVEKTWDTLIRKAQQYQNILQKQGSGKTLTVNEMKFLTELRDLYDQAGEKAEEAGEKGEKFNQAMDAARANIRDQVVGNYSNVIGQMDSASKNKPAAYNDQVQQLQANLERLRSTDFGNDEWFKTIEKLDAGIKKINSDLNAKPIDESARITLNRQMSEWIAKNGRAGEFADQVRQLQDELAKADSQGALQKVSDGFEKIKKDAIEAGKVGQTFADGLIKRFKSLGQYLLSFASFYRVIGMFKQAFSIVKELDTGLMEVRKVSSESLSSLKEWQATTFDQANAVGGTAAQIESSTAAWLRLGKSFTEAQEAAQASVELLNVSEFTSIDDATTSLVSMRQAFEDLSYEDFIDKLNAVGDNYSSSTDKLAQGMQNISAVLKTAGNDIDQSLALLTAANDITQDMSKASMGVRTIALRIAGTEEAKQELEDLGEDVSDFVVQTQSKVDAQVRKYTATASNPNGISVLDSNGRLRDTYDILLDIANVYSEIVEKDEQFGTNTSNALLELLAGKTRSNILASILQNPELLKNAYETSQNAEGTGQRELDVYLDSIEAKLQKLQNRIQELAYTAMNSEFLKVMIDLLTQGVELVTALVDKLGLIPTLLTTLGSGVLNKLGNGSALAGLLKIGNGAKTFFKGKDIQNVAKSFYEQFSDEITKLNLSAGDNFVEAMSTRGFANIEALKKSELWSHGFAEGMTDVEIKGLKVSDVMENLSNATYTAEEGVTHLAGGFSKLVSGFSSFLTAGIQIAAVIAAIKVAVWGVQQILDATVFKEQRIKEAGEVADKNIAEVRKRLEDPEKFQEDSSEEYVKLRSGIDPDTNKNMSLANDEYEKFISLNNEIAKIYPQAVKGYDSQGNAILNLSNNAEEATLQLKDLLATEKEIASAEVLKNLPDSMKSTMQQVRELQKQITENESLIEASKNVDFSNSGSFSMVGSENINVNGALQKYVSDVLSAYGLDEVSDYSFGLTDLDLDNKLAEYQIQFTSSGLEKVEGDAEAIFSKIQSYMIGTGNASAQGLELTNASLRKEIASLWNDEAQNMILALNGNANFSELSETLQNQIANAISSIDPTTFELPDGMSYDDFFKKQYLYPITNILNLAEEAGDQIPDNLKKAQDAINGIFNMKGSLTSDRYSETLDGYLQNLHDYWVSIMDIDADGDGIVDGEKYYKDFVEGFKLGVVSDGETTNMVEQLQARIRDEVFKQSGNHVGTQLKVQTGLTEAFGQLGYDALQEVLEMIQDESFSGNVFDAIKKVQSRTKNIKTTNTGTLSDVINDENYQDKSKEYESGLSSLSTALEKLRTDGKLTADELLSLQNTFSDLTDFTSRSLEAKGVEILNKQISDLRENYATASEEGKKQIDTYIDNLLIQQSSIVAGEKQARQAMFDGAAGNAEQQARRMEELVAELESQYGEDLDWNIVWQLAVNDQLSGDLEDIYARYDERVINWHIMVDLPKENEELQKNIDLRSSRRSTFEARNSYRQTSGLNSADSYWDNILGLDEANIQDISKQVANARQIWEKSNSQSDYNEYQKYYQSYYQALDQRLKDQIAADEDNIKKVAGDYEKAGKEAEKFQAEINDAKNKGERASQETYDNLAESYRSQAEQMRTAAEGFMWVYNHAEDEGRRKAALEQYNTLSASALSAEQSAAEAGRGYLSDELLEQQHKYNDLKTEAAKIDEEISDAETKHQKVSIRRYDELIKNGDKQIRNLEKQRDTLTQLQSKTNQGTDAWRDYQSQIEEVESSIHAMENSQVGWFETMTSSVSANAQELASTLSTAFSELTSNTGLSIDTMNSLVKQFSDLTGMDVSKIFYESADGMKMNTYAAEALVDAEYSLKTTDLKSEIERQNQIIERNKNLQTEAAREAVSAANQRIDAAERELSMLQALYDEQKDNFTNYQKFQRAQSSENAGSRYEDMQGYWKTAQENFNKGLTGTDEFRAYVEYFDQWGEDTVAAYKRNKDKITRYMTEDFSGPRNFLNDLVAKGFASTDGNAYSFTIPNVEKVAAEMGMSVEWFRDMLGRLEDYGATNDWVESELDGTEKIKAKMQELVEARLHYQELERQGASADVLADQQKVIDTIAFSLENLKSNTEAVKERSGKITSTEIQNAVSDIDALWKTLGDNLEEGSDDYYSFINSIQAYAQANHIPLDVDFKVDRDALEAQFEGYNIPVTYTIKEGSEVTDNVTNEDAFKSGRQKALALDVNDENIVNALNTINSISKEDLEAIETNDGKWDDTFRTQEEALGQLADTLGLVGEERGQIVAILEYLGLITENTEKEFDTLSGEAPEKHEQKLTGVLRNEAKYFEEQAEAEAEAAKWQEITDNSLPVVNAVNAMTEQATTDADNLNSTVAQGFSDVISVIRGDETESEKAENKQRSDYAKVETERNQAIAEAQKASQEHQKAEEITQKEQDVIRKKEEVLAQEEKFEQDRLNSKRSSLEGQKALDRIRKKSVSEQNAMEEAALQQVRETALTPDAGNQENSLVQLTEAYHEAVRVFGEESEQAKLAYQAMNDEYQSIHYDAETPEVEANVEIEVPEAEEKYQIEAEVEIDAQQTQDVLDEQTYRVPVAPQSETLVETTPQATGSSTMVGLDLGDGWSVPEIEDQEATVTIEGDDQATDDIVKVEAERNALDGTSADITLTAYSDVQTAKEEIRSLREQEAANPIVIPVKTGPTAHASSSHGGASGGNSSGAAGANGNYTGRALANGTLMGELGPEMWVDRDNGTYQLAGANGPEMVDLPDDAIVFNADQTDDLLKKNHTSTHGKALANGNVKGIALENGFTKANASTGSLNTPYTNPAVTAVNKNTDAIKNNTKASKDGKKSTDKAKTALDKFNEWLGKWVDWIDNRIDSLSNRIERFEKKADELIDYSKKNQKIQKAMDTLSTIPQYQNAQLKTKKVKGTNGVITEVATGTKGVKKGTLLGDTMRGAVRYQKQADKVMKKAVKSGLLSQKEANKIAKLIQTGEIDIRKYNENVRAVISAYEDWFGKSQQLIDSTYDLKQQFKDLEQTKLDNITEQFETLVGWYEAINSASEATVGYYTAQGRAVNTDDRKEVQGQIGRQKTITSELEKELAAYQKEMKIAANIFGTNSNQYKELQTTEQDIIKAVQESKTAMLDLTHSLYTMADTVRGYVIERVEKFVSKLSGITSLAEKRGTNKPLGYQVTEDLYSEQIAYNNDLIVKYAEDLEAAKAEIARRTVSDDEQFEINSDEYQKLYNEVAADEEALLKLYSANEDLKMSIRNLRWKPFREFQEMLDKISSDFNHIQSFIREGELLDDDGQFTARGFAQIALVGENMDVAEKKIANARAAIEKLNDELAVGTINEETFGEEFEQQMKIIQDSASEAYDAMQKLADLYIKQITEENSILQDLIKSRQDALSKKKAYYDYDKQIRDKNKDVNSLRAQVQALQNVSTDAAKARRAQLQAQLSEAEEDLNETRYDHQIEMQQQGYEQLSEDMQKALDDAIKLINGDQQKLQETAAFMLTQLETNHIDEKAVIADIVSGTGTKIHDETQSMINETLTATAALSEDAQGIANAVSAIATLLGQNPAIMADSLAQILGQLGNEGTLSQAISKFADENGIKINETGLKGVISAIAAPYDGQGQAAKLFAEINSAITGDNTRNSVFSQTAAIKSVIDTIAEKLGLDKEAAYNEAQEIAKQLGGDATISDVVDQFLDNRGIEVDSELQDFIDNITNPFGDVSANDLFEGYNDLISQYNNQLQLLDDLGVKDNPDGSSPATMEPAEAIDMQPVVEAIEKIDPVVNITTNSDGEDISDVLEQIEDDYLKLDSDKGTTGGTTKDDNVAGPENIDKAQKEKEAMERAEEMDKLAKQIVTAQNSLNQLEKNLDYYATQYYNYNRKIADKKNRLAEAKANKEGSAKYAKIKEQIKSLKKKRDEAAENKKAFEYQIKNAKDDLQVLEDRLALMYLEDEFDSYASGTKRVGKDMNAWTNEDWENLGAEMIVRKSDGAILTPLKANDSVIPANLADNLFKWGAISPDKFLSNPFLGKMGDMPSNANVTNQVDQKVEMHFDSLFTIQGDVNADVMDRLEEFGKALTSDRNFQQNVVKFVTKDFVRESKKQGGFR